MRSRSSRQSCRESFSRERERERERERDRERGREREREREKGRKIVSQESDTHTHIHKQRRVTRRELNEVGQRSNDALSNSCVKSSREHILKLWFLHGSFTPPCSEHK